MFHRTLLLSAIAAAVIVAGISSPNCFAQEESASGRLPAYFKEVVSDAQKKEIYAIQSQYDDKLESLEGQIEELSAQLKKLRASVNEIKTAERTAIEKVLTPQQLAKVKKLRAEAQARLAQELLKAAQEAAERAGKLAEPE